MYRKAFHMAALVTAMLLIGCNQQKAANPNVIETKLADGRVLRYTKQELAEAQSWGYSRAYYETALSQGQTHGAIIEYAKKGYWNRVHPGTTPPPDVTPPPQMGVTN
jgi:hypothetical protein